MLLVSESVHYSSDEVLQRDLVETLLIIRRSELPLMWFCNKNFINVSRNHTWASVDL